MSTLLPSHFAQMSNFTTDTGFNFSATDIPKLGGSGKYCLVNIVVDSSGSVWGFRDKIEKTLKKVFSSINDPKYPFRHEILLRVVAFGTGVDGREVSEIHGFKLLDDIQESDYNNVIDASGLTPLYDAIVDSAEASAHYSETLDEEQFISNCLSIFITDGHEYQSKKVKTKQKTKEGLQTAIGSSLESINCILIGVVPDGEQTNKDLEALCDEVGFDAYESMNKLQSDKDIKKLTGFITSNITSSSQAVGSGQKSQVVGSLKIV